MPVIRGEIREVGCSSFVLADESLVEVHHLALDTGTHNLSVLVEEIGDALRHGSLARSSIRVVLCRDRVLVVVRGKVGVPLPLTLLVASDNLLSLVESVPLDVPLVQVEDSHEDEVRDGADRENDLALGEGVIVVVGNGNCREANGDEGNEETAVHQRVNLLPSREVVENSTDFVVQRILDRLTIPLVDLRGNSIVLR
ncbi:hypothetical protein PMAYCL1PPCAC_33458, partial [Pristionchus mayeri]